MERFLYRAPGKVNIRMTILCDKSFVRPCDLGVEIERQCAKDHRLQTSRVRRSSDSSHRDGDSPALIERNEEQIGKPAGDPSMMGVLASARFSWNAGSATRRIA